MPTERPLAAQVAALFANGEQGLWYDASDLSTMYQDSSGSIPVYYPGSGQIDPPVGMILDKRQGLSRGATRFNDAAVLFSGDSYRISPGVYRCYSSSGAYNLINLGGSLAVGKWYELTFTVDSVTVAGQGISLEGGDTTQVAFVATTAGVKRCIFRAAATYVGIKRNAGTMDYQVSGVSICEVRGNHAYQATTTSRPTLSARYNGLLASEKYNDSTYWTWQASFTSEITADTAAPDGSNTAWKITSTNANAALSKAGITGFKNPVLTVWCKSGTWNPTIMVRNATTATNLLAGTITAPDRTDTYGRFTNTDMGNGWRRLRIEVTSGVAVTDSIVVYVGSTGAIPVGQSMYIWRSDLREAGDGIGLPEYQRVLDASNYDASGFPLYLKFDGVDDFVQTGTIDFSTFYSVAVFASCRKLSDASQGMLVEASSAYTTGPDGRFALLAPAVGDTYGARYAAGADVANLNALSVASPNSSVLTMIVDASNGTPANRLAFRRNGSSAGMQANSTLAAPAAMGSWPLYIGRRGGASLPFNGRLYGLLIRAGAANDSQVLKVEKYLNQKAKVA